MSTQDEIAAIERGFWTGDADFYKANVDAECLVAFSELSGVLSNEKVASTVASGARWKELDIEERGFLQPSPDTALLTYRADAVRPNGERYRALVSSLYVKRGGKWKLAFHQQTPMG